MPPSEQLVKPDVIQQRELEPCLGEVEEAAKTRLPTTYTYECDPPLCPVPDGMASTQQGGTLVLARSHREAVSDIACRAGLPS